MIDRICSSNFKQRQKNGAESVSRSQNICTFLFLRLIFDALYVNDQGES